MPGTLSPATRVRFGEFALDFDACELQKDGRAVPLGEQPRRLLEVLVERPGVVVSRQDLRERLWGTETVVDFEHSLDDLLNITPPSVFDGVPQMPMHGGECSSGTVGRPRAAVAGSPGLRTARQFPAEPELNPVRAKVDD